MSYQRERSRQFRLQQVLETASQYFSLLQGGGRAGAKSYLPILRDGLFHLFLETGWQDLAAKILPGARLTVASTIPEVLQLPWELLPLAGDSDVSSIIRLPRVADGLIASSTWLSPGPLRVLFLAAEPIDYEEEEQSILQIAEGLDMALAICESGTWEELLDTGRVLPAPSGAPGWPGKSFRWQCGILYAGHRQVRRICGRLRSWPRP